MVKITADVFSGRPNPSWEIADEVEVRATLSELTADAALRTDDTPVHGVLRLLPRLQQPTAAHPRSRLPTHAGRC